MKKCLFVLFTLLSLCVCAQTPGQKKARFSPEKYRQVMERFVMEKAGVTPDEAKTFFPIFHEMLTEQRKVRREIGKLTHEGKMAKSEADYKRIMERIVDLEIKQIEIEKHSEIEKLRAKVTKLYIENFDMFCYIIINTVRHFS